MAYEPRSRSANLQDKVLRAADRLEPELTRFVQELIRAKSVTGDEGTAQGVASDKLRSLGADVDLWSPRPRDFRGYEPFVEAERNVGARPNVVARFRGRSSAKTLAFNGHIDVVPEGDPSSWRYPPYSGRVSGGRLFGRGACDMKSGLAATIFAVESILDAGVEINNDILVESVIGEESGGMGTLATILRGYRPDAAIIAEPTNLSLTIAQAGCLMFRLVVKGKAAHGASRFMGVSAVEKFQPILGALQRLEERRGAMRKPAIFEGVPNPVPLSVGTVRAGDWDSTVPDTLVAEGRYGVWPGETLRSAKSMFEGAVKSAASGDAWLSKNRPGLTWFGPQWESARISPSHPLCKLMRKAYADAIGGRPRLTGITAGTDMRLFTSVAKCPAVIFGPGDDSLAHFSNEWIDVKEVVRACKVYSMAALAWNE